VAADVCRGLTGERSDEWHGWTVDEHAAPLGLRPAVLRWPSRVVNALIDPS
jgi:hypothetical protein